MNDDDARQHRDIWQLIPWVVNGTAAAADTCAVDEHLQDCADCRAEFALQSHLHSGMQDTPAPIHDPSLAFARLLTRIDGDQTGPDDSSSDVVRDRTLRARSGRFAFAERWLPALVAAVVVQAIGLVAMAGFVMQRAPAPLRDGASSYQTLSRATEPGTGATIRLVPAPTLTLGALQSMLSEAGLRIVGTSVDSAIFAVAPTREPALSADVATTLARLRVQPGVMLAEPIATPSANAR